MFVLVVGATGIDANARRGYNTIKRLLNRRRKWSPGVSPLPLYEFRCHSCGHRFDVLTAYSRKSEVRCPRCEAAELKEILSPVASSVSGQSAAGAPVVRHPFS